MNYKIRMLRAEEAKILDEFIYEAIYIPEGTEPPAKEIINHPDLQVYLTDFGKHEGDICYVAEVDDKIIGAAWTRIMDDYGHIADDTPSWAISLYKEYRGKGIGTALMNVVLQELIKRGYKQTSLAVQKENPAWHLYKRMGFIIQEENDDEYIMLKKL